MTDESLISLTADIVSGFVAANSVTAEALPDLIRSVHGALTLIQKGGLAEVAGSELPKPTAAQIRKSITPDALISFIDGKSYRTLRRHLTAKGYTSEQYREEFGLPNDYPFVAPNYSKARSAMAKAAGLGAKGRQTRKGKRS